MPYKNKEDQKKWRDEHKDYAREYNKEYFKTYSPNETQALKIRCKHVLRQYGLTTNEYLHLIISQNNRCAICGKEEHTRTNKGVIRPLCVDHDHITGKVRGLLCNHCNSMLGHSRDDIQTLENGIKYLQKYREKP